MGDFMFCLMIVRCLLYLMIGNFGVLDVDVEIV